MNPSGARDQGALALARALASLLVSAGAAGFEVGARRISPADQARLHPVERAAVASAVARRRDEFATGRALLRSLIGADVPIAVAADRRPLLPPGLVASLAHDDVFAVAAVGRRPTIDPIVAIGVDIEPVRQLDPDIATLVTRADEVGIDPMLLFSAKESTYKAWSQSGGGFLDHDDVRVAVAGGTFSACVVAAGTSFDGAWAVVGGRWLSVAVLRSSPG